MNTNFQTRLRSPHSLEYALACIRAYIKVRVRRVSLKLAHWLKIWALVQFAFIILFHLLPAQAAEALRFGPLRQVSINLRIPKATPVIPKGDYKQQRLQEMAALWKGTSLEPHTKRLLAMLLQEDGTLTAERRHDCAGSRGCYAIGIQGHHICHRGTPLVSQAAGKPFKKYCYSGALKDFEKEYPGFSFDWRVQFAEYSLRMTQCVDSGKTANHCIRLWNWNEGPARIERVKTHEQYVASSLSLL